MTRILAWVVAVAALLGAALALTFAARGERPPATASAAVAAPSAESSSLRGDGLAPAAGAAVAELASAERSAVALDAPTAPSAADELLVRVLEDGRPAAGAELWYVRGDEVDRDLERRLEFEWAGRGRWLAAFGHGARADARGEARFPRSQGAAVLAARGRSTYAELALDPAEPGPVELALAPDRVVRVRVLDAQGRPVERACVALREPGERHDFLRAASDAEGRAELHVLELAEWAAARLRAQGARVVLSLPARELVEAPVDLDAPPEQELELCLPPTGSVEVVLVDERGAPWSGPAQVFAWISPTDVAELGDAWRGNVSYGRWTEDGRARFEHVGLGVELVLEVDRAGCADQIRGTPGPTVAGERLHFEFALDPPLPALTARLLDEQRRPLARAEVRVSRPTQSGPAHTDDEGVVRLPLDEVPPPGTVVGFQLLERGRECHGQAVLPALRDGVCALGDVVLTPTPLVLRGVVRDAEGRPVRRAQVRCFQGATEGRWYSGTWLIGSDRITDALGRFELVQGLDDALLGVQVEADGFVPYGPRLVAVGTDGLELVLERGGRIAGHLLFPASLWPAVRVSREGEEVRVALTTMSDGGFALGPLPPGSYRVEAGYRWSEAWARVDGVRVVAGEETSDPRLEPLDLTTLFSAIALTIVDPEGAPVAAPRIELAVGGSFEFAGARRDGERWLVAGTPPLRARIAASGFAPLVLDDLVGDRRVELARGPKVELALTGALPALPEGWVLEGRLERQEEPWIEVLPFALDAPVLYLSEPGTYLFSFRLTQRAAGQMIEGTSFWDEPRLVLDARSPATRLEIAPPTPESVAAMRAFIAQHP